MRFGARTGAAGAAVVAAGLLVAGCGSSGGSGGKIETGESGKGGPAATESPSKAPKGSPSGTAASAPPDIKLPEDFDLDFSRWRSEGGRTQRDVLRGAQNYIRAMSAARAYHDVEHGPYRYYVVGDAAAHVGEEIDAFEHAKGGPVTITGTDRYYADKADVVSSRRATVSYCDDQSKAFEKRIKSGKVLRTEASAGSYILYSLVLEKSAAGVWQTSKVVAAPKSGACR